MKVLLFPGQGSQFVGMGKDLWERFPAAREVFERADEALGIRLSDLMFDGPEEMLRETRNAQPAILTHSLAAWAALDSSWDTGDLLAAGHSLGEYSAYTVAGAFKLEDAVRLVRRRGELMFSAGEAQPGTMAAILGLPADVVREVCASTSGIVEPANLNAPGQVVISGEPDAVGAAGEALKKRGAKRVVSLNVSGAFHSPLMAPAARGLEEALAAVDINDACFPVFANATADAVVAADDIRASLVRQLLSPVLWEPTMRAVAKHAPEEWVEIGPGQVLKGLLRQTDKSLSCRTVGKAQEIDAFCANP